MSAAAARIQPYPATTLRTTISDSIVSEVVRECRGRYSNALQAVVLTGSLARAEETVLFDGGASRILGDAEFFLVFPRESTIPPAAELASAESAISRSLGSRGIVCPVHLSGVSRRYFEKLPRHIFTYELRSAGRVVMGDEGVLEAVPEFDARDIEREDAWRLLSNRMVEWLEVLSMAAPDAEMPNMQMFYATVKLWMDAATSLLVFLRKYEPSYRARSERLATLGHASLAAELPFSLREFSFAVDAATAWKLMPINEEVQRCGWEFCDRARHLAGLLWCWEAAQLTRLDAGFSPLMFLRSSRIGRTPWRGWLRTARECRRLRRPHNWRHWWTLSHWGSPRQCVYTVAAECLLRSDDFAPWADDGLASQLRATKLRRFLPLPDLRAKPEDDGGWRRLVQDLAWNYHQFVEGTRA